MKARDKKKMLFKLIVCAKCGSPGGTLVKVDDNKYVHQDTEMCRRLQFGRKK